MEWRTVALILLLQGCAFYRQVDITVEGKNVITPYGRGDDLKVEIHKITSSDKYKDRYFECLQELSDMSVD